MINQSLRFNTYPIQQEQGIHSFQLLTEYYIYMEWENWMKMNIQYVKLCKKQLKKYET